MKLFNITKATLAAFMLTAVVACEDEAEYTPAQIPATAQVYFSNTTATSANVSLEDTEYDVAICRAQKGAALDVNLVTTGSELLKAPASVHFAEGDTVANVKVTFDAAAIGYDNPQSLRIALADSAAMATPYGDYAITVTLTVPSPWTSLGKATMVDDIMTSGWNVPNTPYEVEIQENDLTPGYYRLVNPYTSAYPFNEPGDYDASKNYYLEIHAEDPTAVYFEQTELGLDWGYGMISAWSVADFYVKNGNDPAVVKEKGFYGTLVDGEITFPVQGIVYNMPQHPSGGDGWYYANKSGAFSILLPGYEKKDFSAEVSYSGIFTDAAGVVYAVGQLTLGADAQDVRAVVMTQADDAAAVADALAAGDLEGTPVQAGRIEVPFNGEELGSSNLQLIVAVIDGEEVKTLSAASFEYYGGGGNPWKSLGMGTYTEAILSGMFNGLEKVTYEVEILENSEKPGLLRVMNPYANSVYPYAENDCAPEGYYLEVNACDPEGVYIPMQSFGFDWGYGEMGFVSEGARYLAGGNTLEEVKEAGYLGRLKDNVITFPTFVYTNQNTGAEIPYQGIFFMGEDGYYAGRGIKITLPGAAASAPVKVRSDFVRHLERSFNGGVPYAPLAPIMNKRIRKGHDVPVALGL